HELAQIGDRLVHLVRGLELEDASEAQLDGIRVSLQRLIQQRQRARRVAMGAQQVRASGDGLDAVLRAGGAKLFEVRETGLQSALFRLHARQPYLRRHRELAGGDAAVDLLGVVPCLTAFGDGAEVEQRLVNEAAVGNQIAETL